MAVKKKKTGVEIIFRNKILPFFWPGLPNISTCFSEFFWILPLFSMKFINSLIFNSSWFVSDHIHFGEVSNELSYVCIYCGIFEFFCFLSAGCNFSYTVFFAQNPAKYSRTVLGPPNFSTSDFPTSNFSISNFLWPPNPPLLYGFQTELEFFFVLCALPSSQSAQRSPNPRRLSQASPCTPSPTTTGSCPSPRRGWPSAKQAFA